MQLKDFDYTLPEELIAKNPAQKRDNSRMMVLDKKVGSITHKHFFDVVDLLDENDVLVLNDTRVLPARLHGKKATGGMIEIFLLKQVGDSTFEVLIRRSKRLQLNSVVEISPELKARIIRPLENNKWLVEFELEGNLHETLSKVGKIPLPPYIEKQLTEDELKKLDTERYQTVYSKKLGSVAAPTAGLHFTQEILDRLKNKGVEICYITLNVGLGTFKTVDCENILKHKMDAESFEIGEKTAEVIDNAKRRGKNIVAVGTTSVRTLETVFKKYGEIRAVKDDSQLFIYPGFKYGVVDKIITNFHLPKSTLLMLVSAFCGRDFIFRAYEEAIKEKYRFYSFGDCMFLQ